MENQTIHDRIKIARLQLGLTMAELAGKVGYTGRSAIAKVEAGERSISHDMLVKYAEALKVSPLWLLCGDDSSINSQEQGIKKLTEENERLRAENIDVRFGFSLLEDAFKRLEKINEQIKTDTVQKMCAEIKERCIEGGIYPAFVASVVEQVAKEITDETGE